MTVWSPTDVRGINLPDGCGAGHYAPADHPQRESMTVDCGLCEPLILALGWGWATDPRKVELTPDERMAAEAAEREGSVATNLAMRELGRAVADRIHGVPAPAQHGPQKSLVELVLEASQEERAALAALFTPPPPAETTQPAETTPPAAPPPAPAPVKKTAAAKKTAHAAAKD